MADTARITLSTTVTVLSTDEPIRVFQQLATAAAIAPGRIEAVAGRGSSPITFPLFDYSESDYDMLFPSKLALLMAINAQECVTWQGPHRRRPLQDARIVPRPEQSLRIWLGTGGSPNEVADRILHLHQLLGHSRQILQMDVGGMPQRTVLKSIELLGTEVLPQIRKELSGT